MRKYASAEERAAKNQKTTAILVLRSKYTDFRARFAQCCGSAIIGMPLCVLRFLQGAIAVEARRRRAASASIYIYIYLIIMELGRIFVRTNLRN